MDPDYLHELFAEFGAVQVRRMFGGAGVYADGLMFALVSDGVIYLKADPDSVPAFERESCAPFQYDTKTGKRAIMSYWRNGHSGPLPPLAGVRRSPRHARSPRRKNAAEA